MFFPPFIFFEGPATGGEDKKYQDDRRQMDNYKMNKNDNYKMNKNVIQEYSFPFFSFFFLLGAATGDGKRNSRVTDGWIITK